MTPNNQGWETSPLLLVPLSLAGAIMMLFGAGEWGRWGYLLVFLSIPVSLALLLMTPAGGKEIGFIVPFLAVIFTYIVVRKYYARRKIRGEETSSFSVPD